MKKKNILLLLGVLLLMLEGCSTAPEDYMQENASDYARRMEWWRDARFGMFIHWGPYAVFAGE